MSLHGGPSSSGRRGLVLVAVVGAVALAGLWVALVVAAGGSKHPASTPAAHTVAAATSPTPADPSPPAATAGAAPAPAPEAGPANNQAVADHPALPAASHGGASKQHDKSVGDIGVEGAPNPLGKTDLSPDALTQTEKGRVKLAASQFVLYAYGFTGQGQKALVTYEQGVSRQVVAPRFYDSPGAKVISALARQIKTQGNTATATSKDFEVTAKRGDTVQGTATFTVNTPKSSGTYTQSMTIQRWGAVWRLSAAGRVKKEATNR